MLGVIGKAVPRLKEFSGIHGMACPLGKRASCHRSRYCIRKGTNSEHRAVIRQFSASRIPGRAGGEPGVADRLDEISCSSEACPTG